MNIPIVKHVHKNKNTYTDTHAKANTQTVTQTYIHTLRQKISKLVSLHTEKRQHAIQSYRHIWTHSPPPKRSPKQAPHPDRPAPVPPEFPEQQDPGLQAHRRRGAPQSGSSASGDPGAS